MGLFYSVFVFDFFVKCLRFVNIIAERARKCKNLRQGTVGGCML